jgi:hypothetical protein
MTSVAKRKIAKLEEKQTKSNVPNKLRLDDEYDDYDERPLLCQLWDVIVRNKNVKDHRKSH